MIRPRHFRPTFLLFAAALLLPLIGAGLAAGSAGWRQVEGPRVWTFPKDHGAHPDYRTEWWYFTGNLTDDGGNRYGYELTFFRQGIRKGPRGPSCAWSLRDLYLAHFAMTDAGKKRFSFDERVSRTGPGLAGSRTDRLDVRLLGWSARMEASTIRLRAMSEKSALALDLVCERPPILEGEGGVSRKGPSRGQASYYVSCTPLGTSGSIAPEAGKAVRVRGVSWFDHEFGSNQLAGSQAGWDWFGLHLSDGRELMLYLLRRKDGSIEPASSGTVLDRAGPARHIPLSGIRVEVTGHWKSPASGGVYPSRWRVRIPGAQIDLSLAPLLADQELVTAASTGITYWEGAVMGRGTSKGGGVTCTGYVEMTGYAGGMGVAAGAYQ